MRIVLNEKASRQIEKYKDENRDRKLTSEQWNSVICDALLRVPQSVWREQIERHTPASFLIDQALKDPKLAKQMTEFLRAKMNPKDEVAAASEP